MGINMFAKYIKKEGLLFKHALGMRDVIGREFHTFNEIFLLLGGEARFTADEYDEVISPSTLVIIPRESYHRFDPICDECEYHRCVLQFNTDGYDLAEHAMRHTSVIYSPSERILSLFNDLCDAENGDYTESDKLVLLRSVFDRILLELKYGEQATDSHRTPHSRAVSDIIEYIDAHFLETLTVSHVAQKLHFSATYVSHKFKNEMGITLYQYLLKKKLVHAYSLICSGVCATDAALRCGFSDYSTFYKRYKAHFGESPSNTAKK